MTTSPRGVREPPPTFPPTAVGGAGPDDDRDPHLAWAMGVRDELHRFIGVCLDSGPAERPELRETLYSWWSDYEALPQPIRDAYGEGFVLLLGRAREALDDNSGLTGSSPDMTIVPKELFDNYIQLVRKCAEAPPEEREALRLELRKRSDRLNALPEEIREHRLAQEGEFLEMARLALAHPHGSMRFVHHETHVQLPPDAPPGS